MQGGNITVRRTNTSPLYPSSRFGQHFYPPERLLELKLNRKVNKMSKRDLQRLYGTLTPRSVVSRTSLTAVIIKEPGIPEVRISNSDIAKLDTKEERNTTFWHYLQHWPHVFEKIREDKISIHMKELKKKYSCATKVRHNEPDKKTGHPSANSNISKSITPRKPTKPQKSSCCQIITSTSSPSAQSNPSSLTGERCGFQRGAPN